MRKMNVSELNKQIMEDTLDLNPDFEDIIVCNNKKEVIINLRYNDLRESYPTDDAFIWSVTTKGGIEIKGVDQYDLLIVVEDLLR